MVAMGKSNDCLIGGRGQVKWLTDVVVGASQMTDRHCNAVVEGKSNDWLMWWQWASQMTDWCGSRGQVKWLADVVMQWCSNAVVEGKSKRLTGVVAMGKSNDWLMWWQWASQMTDWCGGRGQVKWLTDVVIR